MPPNRGDRPGSPPRTGPNERSVASTATITAPLIIRGTDLPARSQSRSRAPIADASLYAPAAGRTLWALSIRCPYGCGIHLGRVREEADAPGPRRTGCGRKVVVKVRATYRGRADLGAVA